MNLIAEIIGLIFGLVFGLLCLIGLITLWYRKKEAFIEYDCNRLCFNDWFCHRTNCKVTKKINISHINETNMILKSVAENFSYWL